MTMRQVQTAIENIGLRVNNKFIAQARLRGHKMEPLRRDEVITKGSTPTLSEKDVAAMELAHEKYLEELKDK